MRIDNLVELALNLHRVVGLQHCHGVTIPVHDLFGVTVDSLGESVLADVASRAEFVDCRQCSHPDRGRVWRLQRVDARHANPCGAAAFDLGRADNNVLSHT